MAIDLNRRLILQALIGLPLLGRVTALATENEAGIPGPSPSAGSAPGRPLVARCVREGLLDEKGALNREKLDDALGAALKGAVGEESPVASLRRLFRPTDVVGLKLNCLAGRRLSPSPLLVHRLCDWLQEAGVPARNIVIWERSDRELRSAGFKPVRNGSGVRCMGTNDDYDWRTLEWGPGGSCFAQLLTSELTALINVGVLKDHDLAGVSVGLKNWYGAIHNPNKYHDEGCAPFIHHLAAYPLIRDKLRLTVVDASTAQCHGGPARNAKWTWGYQGLLASTDPVAVDALGWRLIEERRSEVGLPTLAKAGREPTWIGGAAKLGLGEDDVERIEVVDL